MTKSQERYFKSLINKLINTSQTIALMNSPQHTVQKNAVQSIRKKVPTKNQLAALKAGRERLNQLRNG